MATPARPPKPAPASGAEFEQYGVTPTLLLRDKLVLANKGLVTSIARNCAQNASQRDDLEQVGYVGLIKAVERYDASLGVPFEAYARTAITGEIFHYLRDLAPVMRVPRWYRTLNHRLHEAHDRLTVQLGHEPTTEALAADMLITVEGVREILRLRDSYNLMWLADKGERSDDPPHPEAIKSTRHHTFRLPVEDRMVLDNAIERLAEFERSVIELFFFKDLTQTEIARRLGFSQKHISRTIATTLRKLKEDLH